MSKNKGPISRRDFLRTAGAVGAGSLLLPLDTLTAAKAKSNSIFWIQPTEVQVTLQNQ